MAFLFEFLVHLGEEPLIFAIEDDPVDGLGEGVAEASVDGVIGGFDEEAHGFRDAGAAWAAGRHGLHGVEEELAVFGVAGGVFFRGGEVLFEAGAEQAVIGDVPHFAVPLGHFGAWVDEGDIVAEEGLGGGGLGGCGGAGLGCGLAAAGVEDLGVEG